MNKEYKFTIRKALFHFITIIQHKYFVFIYCCKCGIPWQGIIHDLSKFSPTEFLSNVKYVRKGISPIDVQKQELGYAPAWMHHKGRNPHHHVYWMDRFDEGCYVTRMPYKYIVEELCDILAANRTYTKKKSYEAVYLWWSRKRQIEAIHPDNRKFLDEIFKILMEIETNTYDGLIIMKEKDVLNKKYLKETYDEIIKNSTLNFQLKLNTLFAYKI